jgi:hypothetical protein
MNPSDMSLEQALLKARGQKLTSVQFIHDYVQLDFESADRSAGLNAYAHPTLRVAGHDLNWASALFRHELCMRIGRTVADTWVNEQSVSIGFDDGVLLVVPILGTGSGSPESLEFRIEGISTIWVT